MEHVAENQSASDPRTGTAAMLLDLGNERRYPATIASWVGTEVGLVLSARLDVTAEAAKALAGRQVLVSVRERPTGYTLFSGLARADQGSTLDISGVATLVRERRRRDPRGAAAGRVVVSTHGQPMAGVEVIDLSCRGVRVSLPRASDLHLGDVVMVEVDLGDGPPMSAHGEVSRVDESTGQAVLRFADLTVEDELLIDRFVLLQTA